MGFVQNTMHNAFTDAVFPFITYLGEAGCIWIIVGIILLFMKKTRKCGIMLLVAMLGCYLLGELLVKNLVCRPRPFMDHPEFRLLISPPSGFSFPSGHSGSSFAAAAVIFSQNRKFGIAAGILALLIAFSRIFLFVHYPTDVISGIILGIIFAVITVIMAEKITASKHKMKHAE